jgi:hypothetical protein
MKFFDMKWKNILKEEESNRTIVHDDSGNRIEKPDKFNLVKGMTYNEIYNELHCHVSGETTQELVTFFNDETSKSTKKTIEKMQEIFGDSVSYSSHEVIDNDEKYAVILKSTYESTGNTVIRKKAIKYISGINDEELYFVHPINQYDGDDDVKQMLNWINRMDEGFTERLQGDILLKFIPYPEEEKIHQLGELTATEYNYTKGYSETKTKNKGVLVNKKHRITKPKDKLTIELGRHILLVRNTAVDVQTNNGTYVVVESDMIQIMHPEHKMTTRTIPEGHYALLANQRGRSQPQKFD